MIPKVAKADNQSETSKIAYGVITQIMEIDIKRFVNESLDLANRKSKEDTIIIMPARTTVMGKPVSII